MNSWWIENGSAIISRKAFFQQHIQLQEHIFYSYMWFTCLLSCWNYSTQGHTCYTMASHPGPAEYHLGRHFPLLPHHFLNKKYDERGMKRRRRRRGKMEAIWDSLFATPSSKMAVCYWWSCPTITEPMSYSYSNFTAISRTASPDNYHGLFSSFMQS